MADIKKHEDTPEFVERRNLRLLDFFNRNGFRGQVRLIGDENAPAVLYQDEYVLCCYVKNFDVIFTDAVFEGNEVKRYKLLEEPMKVREELVRLLADMPARKVYRIKLKTGQQINDIYVCGWNYDDQKNRYPVFSKSKPKVYFTEGKAMELADELKGLGYECEVV